MAVTQKHGFFGYGMCNPVIKKMAKKSEAEEFQTGEAVSSYKGIVRKTLYFLFCCLVGMGIFFPLHSMFMANADACGGAVFYDNVANLEGIIALRSCSAEMGIFFAASCIVLLAPMIAWLIRPTIPVFGTLYALCEGYFIGVITEALVPDYKWISLAALVITVVLVAAMLFCYKRELIKVTKKFRIVVSALFFTSLFSGLILFLLSFVPALKPILTVMTASPIISIVLSVIYILIATLFLLVDFDVIKQCVEEGMPKKYEWMAAFGLTYTIIYIYFKILNLIMQITSSGKKNQ